MKRKNDENCVVANVYTVFWFNKQNEFEIQIKGRLREGKAGNILSVLADE
jgi:hypothetical protein